MLSHKRGEFPNQLLNAFPGHRGNLAIVVAMTFGIGAELLRVSGDRRIEFRSADDPRLFRECLRVQLQLVGDDLRVSAWMIVGRQVDEMDEDGAALHVTEELMAE